MIIRFLLNSNLAKMSILKYVHVIYLKKFDIFYLHQSPSSLPSLHKLHPLSLYL